MYFFFIYLYELQRSVLLLHHAREEEVVPHVGGARNGGPDVGLLVVDVGGGAAEEGEPVDVDVDQQEVGVAGGEGGGVGLEEAVSGGEVKKVDGGLFRYCNRLIWGSRNINGIVIQF